jgi:hypothetical protein
MHISVCTGIVENAGRTIKTADNLPSPTWVSGFLKEDSVKHILIRPKQGSITRANTSRMHASGSGTRAAHFAAFNRIVTKGTIVGIGMR